MSTEYTVRLQVTSHGATAEEIADDIYDKVSDLSVNAQVHEDQVQIYRYP